MTIGIPAVIALQAQGPGPGLFDWLVLLGPMFLIFYFFLIRPQQRRQREHEALLRGIDKGDAVVTTGGLHGRVVGATDEVLTIDIGGLKGERVRVKVDRAKIDRRVESAQERPKEKPKEKGKGS